MRNSSVYILFALLILWSCGEDDPQVDCTASDLSIEVVSTTPATCGDTDGTVSVLASGGSGEYQYSIDNEGLGDATSFNTSSGVHDLTVEDSNGCTATVRATVVQSDEEVSYSQRVAPIIEQNCALPNCHVPGGSRQDFTSFTRIQQLSTEIRRRTQSREMPRDGELSQSQIDLIACWVDQGAQAN